MLLGILDLAREWYAIINWNSKAQADEAVAMAEEIIRANARRVVGTDVAVIRRVGTEDVALEVVVPKTGPQLKTSFLAHTLREAGGRRGRFRELLQGLSGCLVA